MTDYWIEYGSSKEQAKLRLICFHHAGGAASFFQNWAEQLPKGIQICALQLPGRWNRITEKPYTDMKTAIEGIDKETVSLLDMPFVVLGYSFGARVAFEWLRSLRRGSKPLPLMYFSLASKAPSEPKSFKRETYSLPEDELIEVMTKAYGPFPEIILRDPQLRKLMLGILRADMQIFEDYEYYHEEPFEFPIVAIGGTGDRMVSEAGVESWKSHTKAEFSMRMYEGGHFFGETHQKELLAYLSEQINRFAAKILQA